MCQCYADFCKGKFEVSPPVIFLMGATTTGKTNLAISLFKHYPIDIISVDSAMVYRGMDIGTNKPTKELLQDIPHRLVDICDPYEVYSAFQFRIDALQAIDEIHACNRIPLLVGGSGLYFRVLENGIANLPAKDKCFREKLTAEAEQIGWQALHQRLAIFDPISAAKIHPNDPQRIQRALEIHALTNHSMSHLHQYESSAALPFKVVKFILNADRKLLHEQIRVRFAQMLKQGLVEEVLAFYEDATLNQYLPAMRIIGYRQVWEYLNGQSSYAEMVEKVNIATRQLVKRQLTWLRKETNAIWQNCDTACIHEIFKQIKM